MAKKLSQITFYWFLGLAISLVLVSNADAINISYTADTQLNFTDAGTPVYIISGSAADSVTVTGTTLDASVPTGSTFTLGTSTANLLTLTPVGGSNVWLGFNTTNFTTGYVAQWTASSTEPSSEADFSIKVPSANTYYTIAVQGGVSSSPKSDSSSFIGYRYSEGFSTSNRTFTITELSGTPASPASGGSGGGTYTPAVEPVPVATPATTTETVTETVTETTPIPTSETSTQTPEIPVLTPSAFSGVPPTFIFEKILKLGTSALDVKYLQIILNSDPNTKVAELGAGSPGKETNLLGAKTKAAVIKFQEKYTSEILAPLGLQKGTGFVGRATITKLNAIINSTPVPTPTPSAVSGVPSIFIFQRILRLREYSLDVKYLQIILNSDSDTKIAESGAGSPGNETIFFGALTRVAVIKFQEKYASEILTPLGLQEGTGFVGRATITKLNAILAR